MQLAVQTCHIICMYAFRARITRGTCRATNPCTYRKRTDMAEQGESCPPAAFCGRHFNLLTPTHWALVTLYQMLNYFPTLIINHSWDQESCGIRALDKRVKWLKLLLCSSIPALCIEAPTNWCNKQGIWFLTLWMGAKGQLPLLQPYACFLQHLQ